jgi:transposase-like protein
MNNTLDHLSPQEIETLILRYYRHEKVTDLLEEYKLKIKPNQIVKIFPVKPTSFKCPNCSANLTTRYHGRESRKNRPECPKCDYKMPVTYVNNADFMEK